MLGATLDAKGLRALRAALLRGRRDAAALLGPLTREMARIEAEEVRKRVPLGKGPRFGRLPLRETVRPVFRGAGLFREARIGMTGPHAAVIEGGSRAHEIRARRTRVLAFRLPNGRVIFRRRVWHPGTRAYRPLERGHAAARQRYGPVAAGYARRLLPLARR